MELHTLYNPEYTFLYEKAVVCECRWCHAPSGKPLVTCLFLSRPVKPAIADVGVTGSTRVTARAPTPTPSLHPSYILHHTSSLTKHEVLDIASTMHRRAGRCRAPSSDRPRRLSGTHRRNREVPHRAGAWRDSVGYGRRQVGFTTSKSSISLPAVAHPGSLAWVTLLGRHSGHR